MKRIKQAALSLLLLLCLLLSACGTAAPAPSFDLEDIPEFSGEPYVVLEDNRPNFPEEEWSAEPFEEYSPLDSLGRCGPAYACVGLETMPTEERGSIGQVKPSGWKPPSTTMWTGSTCITAATCWAFSSLGRTPTRRT